MQENLVDDTEIPSTPWVVVVGFNGVRKDVPLTFQVFGPMSQYSAMDHAREIRDTYKYDHDGVGNDRFIYAQARPIQEVMSVPEWRKFTPKD